MFFIEKLMFNRGMLMFNQQQLLLNCCSWSNYRSLEVQVFNLFVYSEINTGYADTTLH